MNAMMFWSNSPKSPTALSTTNKLHRVSPKHNSEAKMAAGRAEILPSLLSEVQSGCQPLWNTSACSWSSAGQKQVREDEQVHAHANTRTNSHARVHTSTHTVEYEKKAARKLTSSLVSCVCSNSSECQADGSVLWVWCVCVSVCVPHTLLIRAAQILASSRSNTICSSTQRLQFHSLSTSCGDILAASRV